MSHVGPVPASFTPLLPDADLKLVQGVDWGLPAPEILACLLADIPWRQENITLFGRTHRQPRLICWMGDAGCAYRYSGKRHEPEVWQPLVADLRAQAEMLAETAFNSVLINLYRDGRDSMGFHADDERELGERPVIASLSFGARRIMHFRHRHDRTMPTHRIPLADASLLLMRGTTQMNWKHAIPSTRRPLGPRINLTFRRIVA